MSEFVEATWDLIFYTCSLLSIVISYTYTTDRPVARCNYDHLICKDLTFIYYAYSLRQISYIAMKSFFFLRSSEGTNKQKDKILHTFKYYKSMQSDNTD